jgi:hypothetical protein
MAQADTDLDAAKYLDLSSMRPFDETSTPWVQAAGDFLKAFGKRTVTMSAVDETPR